MKFKFVILSIILIGVIGCKNSGDSYAIERKNNVPTCSFNGYTYYNYYHQLAPTPETLKRCMKEAIKEMEEEEKQNRKVK